MHYSFSGTLIKYNEWRTHVQALYEKIEILICKRVLILFNNTFTFLLTLFAAGPPKPTIHRGRGGGQIWPPCQSRSKVSVFGLEWSFYIKMHLQIKGKRSEHSLDPFDHFWVPKKSFKKISRFQTFFSEISKFSFFRFSTKNGKRYKKGKGTKMLEIFA